MYCLGLSEKVDDEFGRPSPYLSRQGFFGRPECADVDYILGGKLYRLRMKAKSPQPNGIGVAAPLAAVGTFFLTLTLLRMWRRWSMVLDKDNNSINVLFRSVRGRQYREYTFDQVACVALSPKKHLGHWQVDVILKDFAPIGLGEGTRDAAKGLADRLAAFLGTQVSLR